MNGPLNVEILLMIFSGSNIPTNESLFEVWNKLLHQWMCDTVFINACVFRQLLCSHCLFPVVEKNLEQAVNL
jgi:hypothetical protein